MTPAQLAKLDKQLSSYLDYLTDGMGRPERRRALAWYMTGLLLDGESKSVVSMAGRLVDDEREIEAMRQRLQQCVTVSAWADAELRRRLAERLERELRPDAYVLDDTGFAKKGTHSVQALTHGLDLALVNRMLSQRRADSVRQWLINAGIEAARIEAKGFGDEQPLVPNLTPDSRARNRRVQFTLLKQ